MHSWVEGGCEEGGRILQAVSSNVSVRLGELLEIWKEYKVEVAPRIVSKPIKSMTKQYWLSYSHHVK